MICNTDGKDALSYYRIDRMEQVEMNFERGRDFYSVESVDGLFEISKYLEEHPRMSYEEPVSATLLVDEALVEAVELEFRITAKMKAQDNFFRMRIVSTKTAICNWIINLTEYIRIETTSDPFELFQTNEQILVLQKIPEIELIQESRLLPAEYQEILFEFLQSLRMIAEKKI